MNIEILGDWKVIDISSIVFPEALLKEIEFYGISYYDEADIKEHLYDAQELLAKDDNEEIEITLEERELIEEIRKLQYANDAAYFRIIKS